MVIIWNNDFCIYFTLRSAVPRHLPAKLGQKIDVAFLPDGPVELRAIEDAPHMNQLKGASSRPEPPRVSLEDMQDAIARGNS